MFAENDDLSMRRLNKLMILDTHTGILCFIFIPKIRFQQKGLQEGVNFGESIMRDTHKRASIREMSRREPSFVSHSAVEQSPASSFQDRSQAQRKDSFMMRLNKEQKSPYEDLDRSSEFRSVDYQSNISDSLIEETTEELKGEQSDRNLKKTSKTSSGVDSIVEETSEELKLEMSERSMVKPSTGDSGDTATIEPTPALPQSSLLDAREKKRELENLRLDISNRTDKSADSASNNLEQYSQLPAGPSTEEMMEQQQKMMEVTEKLMADHERMMAATAEIMKEHERLKQRLSEQQAALDSENSRNETIPDENAG